MPGTSSPGRQVTSSGSPVTPPCPEDRPPAGGSTRCPRSARTGRSNWPTDWSVPIPPVLPTLMAIPTRWCPSAANAGWRRTCTTRYRDGAEIPNVTDTTAWTVLGTGAWSNYNNDTVNDALYGKLYNWFAASDVRICPQGWHVPTDADWQALELSLGMLPTELSATSWRHHPQCGRPAQEPFAVGRPQ
ncbi:MAG: fibrobacter succinogenes major paralogous domain-containing protein [Flavobacteriales bacterium]|nr:fibrobacter succinogenes major paralogous domain-containing protein [Flavobacteriales bacterium]